MPDKCLVTGAVAGVDKIGGQYTGLKQMMNDLALPFEQYKIPEAVVDAHDRQGRGPVDNSHVVAMKNRVRTVRWLYLVDCRGIVDMR